MLLPNSTTPHLLTHHCWRLLLLLPWCLLLSVLGPLLLLLQLQAPNLHLPVFHTHRQQMLLHCAAGVRACEGC
jgi:hypothetical protein